MTLVGNNNGKLFIKSDITDVIKTVISTAIMTVFVFITYKFLKNLVSANTLGWLICCAISGIVGVIVYGISTILLGVSEIKMIIKERL